MFRFINGVTIRVWVRSSPNFRSPSSSPFLIPPSTSRSIYATPGFLTKAFKTRRKMAQVVPRARPLSEVETDPSGVLTSGEKKPRLERSEEQPVASTSTTKQKPANGEKQSKKKASKKKRQKRLPPEPYSHEDVLWRDVHELLSAEVADGVIGEGKEWESPFQYGEEVEVEVSAISSTGTYLRTCFLLRASERDPAVLQVMG